MRSLGFLGCFRGITWRLLEVSWGPPGGPSGVSWGVLRARGRLYSENLEDFVFRFVESGKYQLREAVDIGEAVG